MINKLQHHHSIYANKTVEWFSTDSKEFYQENLKDTKKLETISRNGWIDSTIEYKFNSHGFRSDEFEASANSFMFLGCSFTLGTGVPIEVTWPYLVAQHYDVKNFNLGISGGSNDTAFRLANHYVNELKPKLVLFAATMTNRLDISTDEGITTLRYNSIPDRFNNQFYREWLTYDENCQLNWRKNLLAIKHVCRNANIPFIEVSLSKIVSWPLIDNGRDIMHPGPIIHKNIADYAISLIENGDAG